LLFIIQLKRLNLQQFCDGFWFYFLFTWQIGWQILLVVHFIVLSPCSVGGAIKGSSNVYGNFIKGFWPPRCSSMWTIINLFFWNKIKLCNTLVVIYSETIGPEILAFCTKCFKGLIITTKLMAYQPWRNMWDKTMLIYF